MQTIHFTTSDLARTRLQSTLGPLAEGVFALGVLTRSGQANYARWRGETLGRMRERDPGGTTFAQRTRELGAPEELMFLLEHGTAAPSGPGARPPHRTEATRLALEAWRSGVAPYWDRISRRLEAECEARGRTAMTGGVERLLATLHPKVVWNSPVLEIHDGPDREIRLDGRGLLLCPSVFLPGRAGLVVESERESAMAALVFSVSASSPRDSDVWDAPADTSAEALSALVGQTRAAALRTLTAACSTSQLAERLGISSAGASQHTAVLRHSGLITTRRVRNNVLHTVTPLGMALLDGRLSGGPAGPVPEALSITRLAAEPAADLLQEAAAG
ncbi:ArsR/SmtB family transcription factor [Streptomyces sp. NPDC060334]|uniref:ArsR/SmtB family transcription factor n=1 Tax=Streptomyces sp. NPDC060334 TaxID=3347099 RepID=UPI0036537B38